MTHLNRNWFLEDPIDFEHKSLLLKAYISDTKSSYRKMELYPRLREVHRHSKELIELVKREREHVESIRSEIVGIDVANLSIKRKSDIVISEEMKQIGRIVEFSLPRLKHLEEEGRELEEYINYETELVTVGLECLYKKEGYMMISAGSSKEIPVYRFNAILLEYEDLPGVRFDYITSFQRSLSNTFENIKRKIINKFRELPNPATYVLLANQKLPVQSALLPVAGYKLEKLIRR